MKREDHRRRPLTIYAAAGAAIAGMIAAAASCATAQSAYLLAAAEYPKAAPYPDERSCFGIGGDFNSDKFDKMYKPWREESRKRREAGIALKAPDEFYRSSIELFLSGTDENRVYSPVNVYMALAMLAETTGGNSREQILSALGESGIDSLRGSAKNMWTANYRDDGATTSVLANSLWLSDKYGYKDVTKTLANDYYASTFSGDLPSREMNDALRDWLNEQTGGLLKDAANGLEFDPLAVMSLCSTVYFRAKWDSVFSKNNNDKRTFHGAKGDKETEFMNKTLTYGPYFRGDDYGAAYLQFEDGGQMWFILPDEGKSADDVLSSGEYLETVKNVHNPDPAKSKSVKVNFSVPKFDVYSDMEITDGLKALGITDVFSMADSDFSPLTTDTDEICVSEAKHAARVTIDEEGVTAAAFTAMMVSGETMPPEDEVDFILDRPFIFTIMSDTNQPLFAGIVNEM